MKDLNAMGFEGLNEMVAEMPTDIADAFTHNLCEIVDGQPVVCVANEGGYDVLPQQFWEDCPVADHDKFYAVADGSGTGWFIFTRTWLDHTFVGFGGSDGGGSTTDIYVVAPSAAIMYILEGQQENSTGMV